MRIENLTLDLEAVAGPARLHDLVAGMRRLIGEGASPIRFSIIDSDGDTVRVEATLVRFSADHRFASRLVSADLENPLHKRYQATPFAVAQIVPTGIRCDFGGYAGDATPATNLLARAADFVVTHPNAVNASDINELAPNVLYVEGHSIDRFLLGRLGLRLSPGNRIGTFVDPTGRDHCDEVVHAVNAARAVAGITCDHLVMLDAPVGARIEWAASGSASGILEATEAVLDGVARLLDAGCDAVGGVSVIHGVTQEMCERHMRGEIPNPSGVVEAILTHLISKVFNVPCAHSPLPYYQGMKIRSTSNPRASAEFISTPHYFSVLKGLARAPRLVPIEDLDRPPVECITVNSVGAIVVPATALGGLPALAAEFHGIPLIAVHSNHTILGMTREKLGLKNAIEVANYLEAAGVVLALKNGLSLESLRRPIVPAEFMDTAAT